jgi:propionyl-CoA carboxylase beta chain
MQDIIQRLEEMRVGARQGGGQRRVDAQHGKGKLTARERIDILFDADSFEEWDLIPIRCTLFGLGGPHMGSLGSIGSKV